MFFSIDIRDKTKISCYCLQTHKRGAHKNFFEWSLLISKSKFLLKVPWEWRWSLMGQRKLNSIYRFIDAVPIGFLSLSFHNLKMKYSTGGCYETLFSSWGLRTSSSQLNNSNEYYIWANRALCLKSFQPQWLSYPVF